MARLPQHIVVFICDECELEFEAEGLDGMSPAFPLGWLGINNATTSGDLFCSWSCLGSYATKAAVERQAAAADRKAKRDKLKADVKKKGGTV